MVGGASTAAATSAAKFGAAAGSSGESGFDYIVESADFEAMSASVSTEERVALSGSKPMLSSNGEEIDYLGYRLSEEVSSDVRSLSHSLTERASPERVEAVCVVASEMDHAMERDRDYGQYGPSADLMQVRQTLRCIAAHPHSSDRAIRQAVRAEGKYAAREVLRNGTDPELLEFSLENADVGEWHAVDESGFVNPALKTHRLDTLVDLARKEPLDRDDAMHKTSMIASLREHPNLTGKQRSALERIKWPTPIPASR